MTIKCPICFEVNSVNGTKCCEICGWQIVLYNHAPQDSFTNRLNVQKTIRSKSNGKVASNSEKIDNLKTQITRLKKSEPQNITLIESLLSENKLLRKRVKPLRKILENLDNNELKKKNEQRNLILTKLEHKILEHEDALHDIPNITLICIYDPIDNIVKMRVDKVERKFEKNHKPIFFGVAFSRTSIISLYDADLIIPTASKKVLKFKEGDEHIFELKLEPPQKLIQSGYTRIVHLVNNTLSKYLIK